MNILWILFFVMFLVTTPAYASDVNVMVTEVKEQRSTGAYYNNLEIKLKLFGDDSSSIRGIKTVINSAFDDTGRRLLFSSDNSDRNLLFNADKTKLFEIVSGSETGMTEINLKFKNPARKASVVKEITGELQLFMPDKDPAATILINGFMKTAGKPVTDSALTKDGITITVLSKNEFESLKKEVEKKTKDAQNQGMVQVRMSAFESLFTGYFQFGDNDLLFKINDPLGNLIDMDVIDANGIQIKHHGNMKAPEYIIIHYSEAVFLDAKLRLYLKTEKSVISIPLRLADVALP